MWRFNTFGLVVMFIILALMLDHHKHDADTGELLPFTEWFK